MSRQFLSNTQTSKNFNLYEASSTFQRKTKNTADSGIFSNVNQQSASQFEHNFTALPVLLNSRQTRVQAKLKLGQVNDQYEQEADWVADRVMSMPEPSFNTLNTLSSDRNSMQRKCSSCEEELIQRKVTQNNNSEFNPAFSSQIHGLSSRGFPLSDSERGFFEPRFGSDFSNVRVHNNSQANNMARSINARAFTVGNNIVFGAGEYSPHSQIGKRLFAHELTHVVQQNNESELNSKPVIQRDLASKPRSEGKDFPILSQKEILEAIKYNRSRFSGVDKKIWQVIEELVGKSRDQPKLDKILISKIAQWQSWFKLPADGKISPLTARAMSSELRSGFDKIVKWKLLETIEEKFPGYQQKNETNRKIFDEQVGASAFRKSTKFSNNVSKWELSDSDNELRAEITIDINKNGKKVIDLWLERAYQVRASSLSEEERGDFLIAILTVFSAKGYFQHAMEVLSLIDITSKGSRQQMKFALVKIGGNAKANAEYSRKYLSALLTLTGITSVNINDPRLWLEKNTEAVGKAIAALEQILGIEAALQLMSAVLKSSFTKDRSYSAIPGKAGSVMKLKKDVSNGNKLEADCDVYAVYGARLSRNSGWQIVGYFAFQGDELSDTAHAIALLRRDKGSSKEYLIFDSLETSLLKQLGEFPTDVKAKEEAAKSAGSGYPAMHHYFAPALTDGSVDPRLIEFHPTELHYSP